MTKHIEPATPACDRPVLEIEITDEMVDRAAGALCDQPFMDGLPMHLSERTLFASARAILSAALNINLID